MNSMQYKGKDTNEMLKELSEHHKNILNLASDGRTWVIITPNETYKGPSPYMVVEEAYKAIEVYLN